MKTFRTSTLLTAALLTIGGMAFVGCNKEEAATTSPPAASPTPGQKVGSAIDAATQKVTDVATQAAAVVSPTGASSLEGARNAVEGATEDALTPNDIKGVAGYMTKGIEDRIVNTMPDTKDLDVQIEAFNTAWKNKYKYSFKIKDLAAEYPDAFLHFAQDSLDASKATGTIAPSSGMPQVKITFIQEGGLWRIDIPDNEDGKVLHDNLLAAITALNHNAATWPDSDTEAAQVVTHSITAAIMNQK